jgi:hypothetical protein
MALDDLQKLSVAAAGVAGVGGGRCGNRHRDGERRDRLYRFNGRHVRAPTLMAHAESSGVTLNPKVQVVMVTIGVRCRRKCQHRHNGGDWGDSQHCKVRCCTSRLARGNASGQTHSETSSN